MSAFPWCYRKRRFATEAAAVVYGSSAWTALTLRAYRCPNDSGEIHYHLTKVPGAGATVQPDLSCRAERNR